MKSRSGAKSQAMTIALEVGPRAAKVMAAFPAPFRIQRLNASTVSEQIEDPVAALRVLLEAGSLGTHQTGLLVGREVVSLRTLELPSTNLKEISSMLELQLGKLTPYPRADILFGWAVIGSFREGYTSVFLAIVRKTLIDGILGLLKSKGITPQWLGVSTEGLESWWTQPGTSGPASSSDVLNVLIDVDVSSTDCAILSNNRLLFTHSVTIGAEQLKVSEPAKLRWLGELVRLPRILSHEEIKGRLGAGVVTGITQGVEPLVEQLTSQWGVPVEVRDALAPFAPSSAVVQQATATGVSYTALAGVLASGKPPRIDLIPTETRVLQALQVRSRHLARFAGSLAVLVVLGVVLYLERMVIVSQYLRQLQQRLAAVEPASRQIVQQQEAMRRIRAWLDPVHSALEIVRAVTSSVNSDITISTFSFHEDKPVTIRGRAGSSQSAYRFSERLKAHAVFANVHARSVDRARGANVTGWDFEIVCDLRGS